MQMVFHFTRNLCKSKQTVHDLACQGDQLRLWIIKAKQDWEEKMQQKGHKGETNDQEHGPQFYWKHCSFPHETCMVNVKM